MRGTWSCVASVGDNPCLRPEDGDTEVPSAMTCCSCCAAAHWPPKTSDCSPRSRPRSPSPTSSAAWPRRPPRLSRLPKPTGCAPPFSMPSATTCAPRSRRRRLPCPACAARTSPGARTTGKNCSPTPTPPWTGSPTWSPTCSTCLACKPECWPSRRRRWAWTTSSAAPWTTSADQTVRRPERARHRGRHTRGTARSPRRRRPARTRHRQPGRQCPALQPSRPARTHLGQRTRQHRRSASHRSRSRHSIR